MDENLKKWNKIPSGWNHEVGEMYILENDRHPEANTLHIIRETSQHEIANGKIEHLFEMADKYYKMLEKATENHIYDTTDVMPLPQTDEIRIFDHNNTFTWGVPIPFSYVEHAKEFEYQKDMSSREAKDIGIDLELQREVVATNEEGKEFPKIMEIYRRANEDRLLLSFGSPYIFELDLFIDDVKNNSLKDVCIDAGGRNHGSPSSVYVDGDVVSSFVKQYLDNERAKTVNQTMEELKRGDDIPAYATVGRGGWSLHFDNETRTVVSGYDNDRQLAKFIEAGVPTYDSRTIFEDDILETMKIPLVAFKTEDKNRHPFEVLINFNSDKDTLENVFIQYANLGADIYNVELPDDAITYNRELRRQQIEAGVGLRRAMEIQDWEKIGTIAESGLADINIKNYREQTPLSLAVMSKDEDADIELIKTLIDNGADINTVDQYGWTPLSRASYGLRNDVIELLLDNGANMKENIAIIPLLHDSIPLSERMETVKLLLDKGANVNYLSSQDKTLLMMLIKTDNLDAVKSVVESGADILLQNRYAQSAYRMAMHKGDDNPILKYFDEKLDAMESNIVYVTNEDNRADLTFAINNGDIKLRGMGNGEKGNPNYQMDDYEYVLKSGIEIGEHNLVALTHKGVDLINKIRDTSSLNLIEEKNKKVDEEIKKIIRHIQCDEREEAIELIYKNELFEDQVYDFAEFCELEEFDLREDYKVDYEVLEEVTDAAKEKYSNNQSGSTQDSQDYPTQKVKVASVSRG